MRLFRIAGKSVAISAALFAVGLLAGGPLSASDPAVVVTPAQVELSGNFARAQLLVARAGADGSATQRSDDLTTQATYATSNATIVTVSESGQLLAVGNGEAKVTATVNESRVEVPVTVRGVTENPHVGFSESIRPILNKAGCAMAACHAAQHGKGGFKLSVFGFEPDKDRDAMARESLARRISLVEPERSLLLLKPTMQTPHGGGKRLEKGSVDYQILLGWIAAGTPAPKKDDPEVVKLTVTPPMRVGQAGLTQQLRVVADYSNGTSRDVTASARYDSLDDGVVTVSTSGYVTAIGKGQAAVMVRYEGQAAISLLVMPYADRVELTGWQSNNFIDDLAATKFRELGIEPSPLGDDATFIRRAYLDAIGTLPTPEETTAFLASADSNKRTRLVDRLLGISADPAENTFNDAYAAWWSLKWSDLLRNNSADLGEQGMWAMHNWIRQSLLANKPFDKFVRE